MKKRILNVITMLILGCLIVGIAIITDINSRFIVVPICIGEEPALESSQEDNWSITEQGQQTVRVTSYFNQDEFQTIVDKFQASGLNHQAVQYIELDDYLTCLFLDETTIHRLAHSYSEGAQMSVITTIPRANKEGTVVKISENDETCTVQFSMTRADIEKALRRKNDYILLATSEAQENIFQLVIEAKNLQNTYNEIDRRDLKGFIYSINVTKIIDDQQN